MPGKDVFRKRIMKDKSLTPFRKKVLLAVLKIPDGEVRTYSQVAVMAGSPKACRAVGQALKRNPYAPDVPCHRVIRSDGSAGGFSGGAEKKRTLLREEGYLCV